MVGKLFLVLGGPSIFFFFFTYPLNPKIVGQLSLDFYFYFLMLYVTLPNLPSFLSSCCPFLL